MADQVPVGKWHHILYTFANPAPMEGMKGWLSLQDSTHFGGAGMAKVYVNGNICVDWTDDGPERCGPPHGGGKIGFRQMNPTVG
jgi:hypothetical protein